MKETIYHIQLHIIYILKKGELYTFFAGISDRDLSGVLAKCSS